MDPINQVRITIPPLLNKVTAAHVVQGVWENDETFKLEPEPCDLKFYQRKSGALSITAHDLEDGLFKLYIDHGEEDPDYGIKVTVEDIFDAPRPGFILPQWGVENVIYYFIKASKNASGNFTTAFKKTFLELGDGGHVQFLQTIDLIKGRSSKITIERVRLYDIVCRDFENSIWDISTRMLTVGAPEQLWKEAKRKKKMYRANL